MWSSGLEESFWMCRKHRAELLITESKAVGNVNDFSEVILIFVQKQLRDICFANLVS